MSGKLDFGRRCPLSRDGWTRRFGRKGRRFSGLPMSGASANEKSPPPPPEPFRACPRHRAGLLHLPGRSRECVIIPSPAPVGLHPKKAGVQFSLGSHFSDCTALVWNVAGAVVGGIISENAKFVQGGENKFAVVQKKQQAKISLRGGVVSARRWCIMSACLDYKRRIYGCHRF